MRCSFLWGGRILEFRISLQKYPFSSFIKGLQIKIFECFPHPKNIGSLKWTLVQKYWIFKIEIYIMEDISQFY